MTATGELEWLSDRVLRVGGSAHTADQRAMAAALDIPDGSLAIFSAAAMWQLPGFDLEPLHVLTDRHPHRAGPHLGVVHSSTSYSSADVMLLRGIPVTTPLRTLRDLAGRIRPERLDVVCRRMLSERLLRVEHLHQMVAGLPRRGGARGTSALRRLALGHDLDERPAESNLERRFEQILASAGEAAFERQVDLGDEDGWIGRVDFLDRTHHLVVEAQSELFHTAEVDRARDDLRSSRLRASGWAVLEVTDVDIWHHPDRVVAAVRSARRAARRPPPKGGSPHQARRTT
jgi:very-short-patch-repair endonuclease